MYSALGPEGMAAGGGGAGGVGACATALTGVTGAGSAADSLGAATTGRGAGVGSVGKDGADLILTGVGVAFAGTGGGGGRWRRSRCRFDRNRQRHQVRWRRVRHGPRDDRGDRHRFQRKRRAQRLPTAIRLPSRGLCPHRRVHGALALAARPICVAPPKRTASMAAIICCRLTLWPPAIVTASSVGWRLRTSALSCSALRG